MNQATEPEKKELDPLKRVWVPIERRTMNGTLVFKTHDNQVYARLEDGSIRRSTAKVNGKIAKKLRRKRAHTHTAAS